VVLQVLADAGQSMLDPDADAAQMAGVADTGELQDMRRPDGPRREDHFTRGVDPLQPAAPRVLDAGGAATVEQDAVDQSIGDDLQVRPLQCRTQIGARRALAPPPAAGLLNPADTVAGARRQMVDVRVVFEPDLGSRLDQLPAQQRLVGGSRRQ
jgi:hypothetical protein